MNRGEENFVRALRCMAAAAPQQAPPELASRLQEAFRRRQTQRRRTRWLQLTSVAACLIAVIVLAWRLNHASGSPVIGQIQLEQAQPSPLKPSPTHLSPPPRETATLTQSPLKASPVRRRGAGPADSHVATRAVADDFIVLPSFDPAIPVERSQIVRVELSGQSLSLFGIPVSGEIFDRRIVADLAVAQDGRPYAVRFVQDYK